MKFFKKAMTIRGNKLSKYMTSAFFQILYAFIKKSYLMVKRTVVALFSYIGIKTKHCASNLLGL